MHPFSCIRYFLLALLFSVMLHVPTYAKETKHILLLNSYHQGMSWVDDIVKAVYDVMEPDKNGIILHIENMDTKRYHSPEYFEMLKVTYAFKYQNIHFDMILSSDNQAFDFLRANGKDLFGDIPMVFCGVNDFHQDMIADYPNFTGTVETISAVETIKMMLNVHPSTKNIFVINDYLKTGKAWTNTIQKDLKHAHLNVNVIYADNLSIKELKEKIVSLSLDTLVLLGAYFSDKNGEYLTYESIGPRLLAISPVPVYNLLEFNIRDNIIGGKVISGYRQGKRMTELAIDILHGKKPSEIPVVTQGTNTFIFNYPATQRYNISIDKYPKEAIFLNKPQTFFEIYQNNKLAFDTLLFFLAFLSVLVFILTRIILQKNTIDKQLKAQLSFQQKLIDTVNIPIFYKDFQGIYLGCNESFEKIIGISKEDIKGKTVFDLAPQDLAKVYKKADDELLAIGGFQEYQTQIKTVDGSIIDVIFQKNTYTDAKGNIAGLVGAYFDITEILETKEALRLLNETLEHKVIERTQELSETIETLKKTQNQLIQAEKMASLGSLVAGVAHEINTPIGLGVTGISHFDDLLKKIYEAYQQDDLSQQEFEDFLTSAREISNITLLNLNRASEIIRSFKQVAVDQSSTHKRMINLREYIEETLLSLHSSIKNTQHKIEIHCDHDINIMTYPGVISQILTNLILNAIIHGFENKESGKITIIAIQKEKMIHLHFEDDGKGISKENISKIYDPFFTTKLGTGGSGLGLNIIYNIITMQLKGTIQCTSEEGKGTVFEITFPI